MEGRQGLCAMYLLLDPHRLQLLEPLHPPKCSFLGHLNVFFALICLTGHFSGTVYTGMNALVERHCDSYL